MVLAVVALYVVPGLWRPDLPELRPAGERIVVALEAHFERHGEYPNDLAEVAPALEAVDVDLGDWEYEVWRTEYDSVGELIQRPGCQIAAGDYSLDGFSIFWSSWRGWGTDT